MGWYDRRDVAISMHLVANETSTKASQSAEQEATTLLGVGGVHSTLSPVSITNTYHSSLNGAWLLCAQSQLDLVVSQSACLYLLCGSVGRLSRMREAECAASSGRSFSIPHN
jgi:hypothetical protein